MIFSNTYFYKIVKYDLINTFKYQNLNQLPNLSKIVLNFGYSKSNLKYLISGLLALEFISSKKGKLTRAKNLNLLLKIKKGNPIGCKVILRKNHMHLFYFKIITSIFSKVKPAQLPQFPQYLETFKSVSFQLKNPMFFAELESQFQIFKNIPNLDVTLCTNSHSRRELFFLLKSIKFIIANVTQFGRV